MRTSIILIITLGLTASPISCQSWPSPAIPSSSFSQYQPYRAPSVPSIPSPLSIPSSGQYQTSPQLQTLSQMSGYSRLSAPSLQMSPWSQSGSPARGWSIPAPTPSIPSAAQFPSAGPQSYARPSPLSTPAMARPATPFQTTFSIQHQSGSVGSQPSALSLPAPQQRYSPPSPPAQTWTPSASPAQNWGSPGPVQSWGAPASAPAPVQSWAAPAPAPVQSWSQSPAPVQTWRQPAPAPVQQWRPPTQTYTAPQPAPVQAAPQPASAPVSNYQSPQNAQNLRPAPVHYASIGPQLQGDYKFGYHTGDGGSFREETRLPDGTVQGAYGFIDADGKQRVVRYRAGKDGFQAEGDDVPKGAPAGAPAPQQSASAPAPAPQPSAPIQVEEGAAFRSFSQG